jgi:acyl-CoA synthetase (AMP-forming)/AMP-acid ligase II
MVITEILARNARRYGDKIALVEREPGKGSRATLTWKEFDEMANRIANGLIAKGVKRGDKVIHLMMNCLEWLPTYFGILRTGAWAVPLNFRFTAQDIQYCAEIAEAKTMFFGEEFIERIDEIKEDLESIRDFVFVGPAEKKPSYAESYVDFLETGSTDDPGRKIDLLDEAASILYFRHHRNPQAYSSDP